MSYPPLWYALWVIIAFCGVGTWYLRNFTKKVQLIKIVALTGVVAMVSMVMWTFIEF